MNGELMKRFWFCLFMALFVAACGKKGPLIPPEALAPAPITDLRVTQTGDRFTLCLSPPSRDEGGRPLKNPAAFRVLKHEVLPPGEDCEECPTAYLPFQTVDLEYPRNVMRFGNLYCLFDTDLVPGKTYKYKVYSFLNDGTTSRDSNKVQRKFLSPPAAPVLRGTSSPTGVVLEWAAPPHPETGTIVGFNIYRGESAATMSPSPINKEPVKGTRYEDKTVVLGIHYIYTVRSLANVADELVESVSSNKVAGELKFPEE
jgi:predicted small lipoprotein YifL